MIKFREALAWGREGQATSGGSFSTYKFRDILWLISGQRSWKLLGEGRPKGVVTLNHFRLNRSKRGREPKDTQVLVAVPRHDYVTIRHPFLSIKNGVRSPEGAGRPSLSVMMITTTMMIFMGLLLSFGPCQVGQPGSNH